MRWMTACIHARHTIESAKKNIQHVVQSPVRCSSAPNNIGQRNPPRPPITPTDGRPVAGPPTRALPRVRLETRNDGIYAIGMEI